jgi:hypothetical protein
LRRSKRRIETVVPWKAAVIVSHDHLHRAARRAVMGVILRRTEQQVGLVPVGIRDGDETHGDSIDHDCVIAPNARE